MHRSTRFVPAVVIASTLGLAACGGSSAGTSQPAGPESSAARNVPASWSVSPIFTVSVASVKKTPSWSPCLAVKTKP